MWDDSDYWHMRWSVNDDDIFALVRAEVWRTMRLTPAWPRERRPLPRHSHASLDDRYVRPVIRSRIGVGGTTPLTQHPAHTPPTHRRTTMHIRKALTIPALALGILAGGLTIGAAMPSPSAPAPHPTVGVGAATPLTEHDPGWDCLTMGNYICGDPDEVRATPAWDTFDRFGGAAKLKVDPSRPFRVDYVGYATHSPKLTGDDLAMPGTDGLWYVFRASY